MILAIDTETHLIQPGLLAPPIVCGSSAHDKHAQLHTRQSIIDFTEAHLRGNATLAGANIAYDFGVLCAAKPALLPLVFEKYERGEVWDVLIATTLHFIYLGALQDGEIIDPRTNGKLKDPSTGKITNRVSLAVAVDFWLDRKDAKKNDVWRLRYAELEHLPHSQWPQEARQYPVDDAVNTYEVAVKQQTEAHNTVDLPAQCAAAWAAHLAAMWGIRTNAERVQAMEAALVSKRETDVTFAKIAGFMRDDGSKDTKVLKARVEAAYQGKAPTTEGGATSTAREVLEESGDEVLERFSEVSKTEKLLKTYLPFVQAGTSKPINVKANVLLNTGRMSHDGLIQLLPRKGPTRECFEPRPGTVWCSVDYAAIELSTLAQVCLWTVGHSKLAEAINDGKDAHTLFAAKMGGKPYEEMLELVQVPGEEKDLRQGCKAADFGFPGGMGAVTFVKAKRKEGMSVCRVMRTAEACGEVKVTVWKGREYDAPFCQACANGAETLRNFYLHQMWTEMPVYFNWITGKLDQSDRLEQFVSKRERGGLRFTQACNTLFQGLASDGFKRAFWAIARECYVEEDSPLYGSRPVVAAHDELILEMPEEKAHAAAHRQAEVMVEKMREVVPDVRVSAEPALMRRWYKDAKAVYVDGVLVPWEPEEKEAKS